MTEETRHGRAEGASESPRIEAVSDLVLIAGALRPKTVIVAGGTRDDDLRLVESARDHGIAGRVLLVGDARAVRDAASRVGIAVGDDDILGTGSPEETASRTAAAVRDGTADIILKGDISTPILNREMLGIAVRKTISLVTVFDTAPVAGGRPMLLTDPGVTTVCSFERMVGLIENAIDVAHEVMRIERPRVALLSANEKQIASLPSTGLARELSEREWEGASVYGPLSFDLAVSPKSVGIKGPVFQEPDKDARDSQDYEQSLSCSSLSRLREAAREVAGRADVVVCPSIDSANVLYKMIMQNVEYGMGTFAGITVGVAVPYVILSRADNVETKLLSIALCSIAAERMKMAKVTRPDTGPRAGARENFRRDARDGAERQGDTQGPERPGATDATSPAPPHEPSREDTPAMTDTGEKKHWVFRVHVADRAGALTSIASAFSNRGISIDTVVGHGHTLTTRRDGAVIVTFHCIESEKDAIVRIVRRLSKVLSLAEHPYDSESLRKSGLITVTRRLTPQDVAGIEIFLTCELMSEARGVYTYFVAGSPSELDPVLARFIEEDILTDIVYSVIGL